MTQPIEIMGMHGLGDNIFLRPFVRGQAAVRTVFLQTPWPELFEDIPNVRFLFPMSNLRTQNKNIQRQAMKQRDWAGRPFNVQRVTIRYADMEIRRYGSITKTIETLLPLPGDQPYIFDLPASMKARFKTPNAVVRPVTIRKEWRNEARNPLPEYVELICRRLMSTHEVILIADLKKDEEWLDGAIPPHTRAYLNGELDVIALLRTVAEAGLVVGGVGWIVPAAIAAGTPAFIIRGGQAAHNSPQVITDPRMDMTKIYFASPDNPCPCNSMVHHCVKTISNINAHFDAFANQIKHNGEA